MMHAFLMMRLFMLYGQVLGVWKDFLGANGNNVAIVLREWRAQFSRVTKCSAIALLKPVADA